jgi:hypothetical protein
MPRQSTKIERTCLRCHQAFWIKPSEELCYVFAPCYAIPPILPGCYGIRQHLPF